MKKFISLLLIIAMLCSCFVVFASCNKATNNGDDEFIEEDTGGGFVMKYSGGEKKKKAIIYVTALFSGGLYNTKNGKAVWEPFEIEADMMSCFNENGKLDVGKAMDTGFLTTDAIATVANALQYKSGTLLYDLTIGEDGKPLVDTIVPIEPYEGYPMEKDKATKKYRVMDISYGVFGIYRPFINGLQEIYGDEYTCEVFTQDWRISPAVSAERLYNYITKCGYEEVIFMSHSMGGPVVNSYIKYCADHKKDNKIKLYLAYAPATLGSYDALSALSDPGTYVSEVFVNGWTEMDLDPSSPVAKLVKNVLNAFTVDGDISAFFKNCVGLMALVPSYQLLASMQYPEGEGGLGYIREGTDEVYWLTNKEEIYDFYKSLDWAYYYETEYNKATKSIQYKRDSEGKKIKIKADKTWAYRDSEGYKLKADACTLDEYYDGLFLTKDGKEVLAQETVNSYYFIGTSVQTAITGMVYDYNQSKWIMYTSKNDPYGTCTKIGDGMVPYYSSIGGMTANVEELYASGRIVEYEGKNHMQVGGDWNMMKEDIIRIINATIGR